MILPERGCTGTYRGSICLVGRDGAVPDVDSIGRKTRYAGKTRSASDG